MVILSYFGAFFIFLMNLEDVNSNFVSRTKHLQDMLF